jgi:hypothetical protein
MCRSDADIDCAAYESRDGGGAGKPTNGAGVRAAMPGQLRPSTTPGEAPPPRFTGSFAAPDDRTDWQEPPEDEPRPDGAEPWHGEHDLTETTR